MTYTYTQTRTHARTHAHTHIYTQADTCILYNKTLYVNFPPTIRSLNAVTGGRKKAKGIYFHNVYTFDVNIDYYNNTVHSTT